MLDTADATGDPIWTTPLIRLTDCLTRATPASTPYCCLHILLAGRGRRDEEPASASTASTTSILSTGLAFTSDEVVLASNWEPDASIQLLQQRHSRCACRAAGVNLLLDYVPRNAEYWPVWSLDGLLYCLRGHEAGDRTDL